MKVELNLKNKPFLFTNMILIMVALFCFGALFVFQTLTYKEYQSDKYISLKEGWEYKWDDSVSKNEIIDFNKLSEGRWEKYTISGKPLKNNGQHKVVWFRIALPSNREWQSPAIYFEVMLSRKVEAYVDGKLFFYDDTYIIPNATSYVLTRNRLFIPLQKEFEGRTLYLKVYSEMEGIGPYRNAYFGQNNELSKLLIQKDIGNIILGFFFIILGFFLLPNIIFINKGNRKSFIYLSTFIISVGLLFISISIIMNTLFLENNIIYYILNSFAMTAAIISFIGFFRQLFLSEKNKLFNIFWNVSLIIFVIIMLMSVWSLVGGPVEYDIVSNVFAFFALVSFIIQMVIVVKNAVKGNIDARIFSIGFFVYSAISLVEIPIYSVTGRVPSMYKWGLLIFISALILILGRRFSDAHEKLVMYSEELVLNNEKLNITLTELHAAKDEVDELNKTLEKRVDDRTNQLKDAMDNLIRTQHQLVQSEKMAALAGLVVGVAHEINTPVGIGVTAASHLEAETKGISELYKKNKIKRSDLDNFIETCIQSTDLILANLKRAADLIKSFKRVAADQSSEERCKFKIREYINEVLMSLSPEIKKTNHFIDINCPDELEINSYPGAFSQVITNLVLNSLIHAYDSGESGNLKFEVTRKDSHIYLRYSDDGKGISNDLINKIFDPFVTTKRNNGGTGLGLNIVYNIVTQTFSGKISCKSESGMGTMFEITFPEQ